MRFDDFIVINDGDIECAIRILILGWIIKLFYWNKWQKWHIKFSNCIWRHIQSFKHFNLCIWFRSFKFLSLDRKSHRSFKIILVLLRNHHILLCLRLLMFLCVCDLWFIMKWTEPQLSLWYFISFKKIF